MSFCKASGLAIFAVVCLLSETIGSSHTQCNPLVVACATEWSDGGVIDLGGRPAVLTNAINDAGQAVGAISARAGSSPSNGAAAASSIWDACLVTTKRPGSGAGDQSDIESALCRSTQHGYISQQFLACPCG